MKMGVPRYLLYTASYLLLTMALANAGDDLLSSSGKSTDPSLSSSGRVTDKSLASDGKPADPSLATLPPDACQQLTQHTPDADVAYQPGVDVNGKPVAPADLQGTSQPNLPSVIKIPLTVNLAKTLNLDTTKYPYNQLGTGTEADLGTIEVDGNRVTLNGQPLSDAQQDNLAVLCMKPHRR